MFGIVRDPRGASRSAHDLIVVGGGVYGAMLALEAARRGLRPLLLERDDFGEHTSFNSLRIIHGGFRYLQSLDFQRFRESMQERRWYLQAFPDLVEPLPCLMPLYGNGLRRPFILRTALWVNDALSSKRNAGIRWDRHLPAGSLVDRDTTRKLFPLVDPQDLKGGALWYDGFMQDSQRVLIETLRWACREGATALNYMEGIGLLKAGERVTGVLARDHVSGSSWEFRAPVVVNAAGPWCKNVASCLDRDNRKLLPPTMAWNILLKREPPATCAVAVAPKKPGAQTYFLVPWHGMTAAGTGHAPWRGWEKRPKPTPEQLTSFLNDLNNAVPGLELKTDDILSVLPGLQPTKREGDTKLYSREVILDHGNVGGCQGLFTVSGVKFTTARRVAEKTLRKILKRSPLKVSCRQSTDRTPITDKNSAGAFASGRLLQTPPGTQWEDALRTLIDEESVQHLDDLVLRRTALWETPTETLRIARTLCGLFPWDERRREVEIGRLEQKLDERRFHFDS